MDWARMRACITGTVDHELLLRNDYLATQTIGNILHRHGIPPAPRRGHATTRKDFIRAHLEALEGTDFFTVEVVTLRGLVTYYVLILYPLGKSQGRAGRGDTSSERGAFGPYQARPESAAEFLDHTR